MVGRPNMVSSAVCAREWERVACTLPPQRPEVARSRPSGARPGRHAAAEVDAACTEPLGRVTWPRAPQLGQQRARDPLDGAQLQQVGGAAKLQDHEVQLVGQVREEAG